MCVYITQPYKNNVRLNMNPALLCDLFYVSYGLCYIRSLGSEWFGHNDVLQQNFSPQPAQFCPASRALQTSIKGRDSDLIACCEWQPAMVPQLRSGAGVCLRGVCSDSHWASHRSQGDVHYGSSPTLFTNRRLILHLPHPPTPQDKGAPLCDGPREMQ